MARTRVTAGCLLIALIIALGACTREEARKPDERNVPNAGLINVIKNGKLMHYPQTTIGTAFDSYRYLARKEWKAERQVSGIVMVYFTGWFKSDLVDEKARREGVSERGLEVTFVINSDGSYYLLAIAALDAAADGTRKRRELTDAAAVIEQIYGNRQVVL